MKKLLLTFVLSAFYVTSASADLGVNVGVTGNAGIFAASATESTGTVKKGNGTEHGSAGWGSVFLEASMNDRFMLGVDYVPGALETDTTETAKNNASFNAAGTKSVTTATNKIQVDFEHLTTLYAAMMISDNLYVKAGVTTVDVITNENLGTGASYADAELDGSVFGIGYHNAMDNGMFFRFEGTYRDFDGTTVTATGTDADNKIELRNLDGVSGALSFGKTF